MNRLNIQERVNILRCLVEGNSIRSTARITGADKKTVLRLLAEFGVVCMDIHDERMRNIKAKRIQTDEIWSFVGAKEKNVPPAQRGQVARGDIYTWVAIDPDTKLIPCWLVGRRDAEHAVAFMRDLASRLANRVQLTTDGLRTYLLAVESAFGGDVDYGMLVKIYGEPAGNQANRKYSPGDVKGTFKDVICGDPDERHICTSHIERQNLNMRMAMRRFTRLTNGFSKKIENHIHALAVYFVHYNFCRVHQTLRVTPAMQAGLTDHVWELEEIAALAEPLPKAA